MKTLHRISKYISGVITALLLTAAYVLGIGVVALMAKIGGTAMLPGAMKRSTWQKPTGSGNMERMY